MMYIMRTKNLIKKIIPRAVLKLRSEYLLEKQRNNFRKGCKELLELVDDLLRSEGIQYWLTYGTLLGAYRDHDFIAHDYDIDIAIFWTERYKIKDLMLGAGFKLKHEVHFGDWDDPENIEYRFELNKTFIDIDFYKVNGNVATTCNPAFIPGTSHEAGVKFLVITEELYNPFEGLSDIDFLGRTYKVPSNTEEFIIANYGKDFRTPIKNYNYKEHSTNVREFTLDEKRSYMIVYE